MEKHCFWQVPGCLSTLLGLHYVVRMRVDTLPGLMSLERRGMGVCEMFMSSEFLRDLDRLPEKGLNNVFLLLYPGRKRTQKSQLFPPRKLKALQNLLSSKLPRGCQEVTLLLSQGIFLRNRKKKLIGTISVGTQRNSLTRILHLEEGKVLRTGDRR